MDLSKEEKKKEINEKLKLLMEKKGLSLPTKVPEVKELPEKQ